MNKVRDLKWYQNRVKVLRAKPQPAQRSPEWYAARNTRITASEAACCLNLSEEICKQYVEDFNIKNFKYKPDHCLSHYDNREDYIINKCRTFYGENLFKDSIYTLHGKKYEEIATRLYRKQFNTEVWEFGLLPHSRLNWLAASPDGITPNGVMLEIKCPYSRKIEEGVPPIWYWVQMQHQLFVADLDECDFLECEIKELKTEQDFITQIVGKKQDKGILLNKISEPDNSETKYIYPPDHLNTEIEYIEWANNIINGSDKNSDGKNSNSGDGDGGDGGGVGNEIVPIYYFISKWFVIKVHRRREWFEMIKPYLKSTIDLIRRLQSNRQLFDDYRESIYKIRNKEYLERYNSTICLIDQDSQHNQDKEDDFVMTLEPTNDMEEDIICLISDN